MYARLIRRIKYVDGPFMTIALMAKASIVIYGFNLRVYMVEGFNNIYVIPTISLCVCIKSSLFIRRR